MAVVWEGWRQARAEVGETRAERIVSGGAISGGRRRRGVEGGGGGGGVVVEEKKVVVVDRYGGLKWWRGDKSLDEMPQEFNIEKMQLVEAEKKKIREEYERKQKQVEVRKKIFKEAATMDKIDNNSRSYFKHYFREHFLHCYSHEIESHKWDDSYLNVSAALLKSGISTVSFTRHENTMIQTCSVASYTIVIGGGFGSYFLALNKKTYEMARGANSPGT
ncbi:ATPase, V1/A1 complex, subunit E [Cynara cardunculus var. scolymus]|uniref:ATPase, V1/A1 complex, subunit E n=1 Tax=Cynara cardunculus var. scolymus TaxID=59895 RepID=A0A124SAQ5_CYNCS|nr:ATPase, V1/A1 complex, subunit E [Cynara cardunculus var. scolymus]